MEPILTMREKTSAKWLQVLFLSAALLNQYPFIDSRKSCLRNKQYGDNHTVGTIHLLHRTYPMGFGYCLTKGENNCDPICC